MTQRKSTQHTKAPEPKTLVQLLYDESLAQRRALVRPCPDEEMNEGLEALSFIATNMANAPSQNTADLHRKMEVLCCRLRENLNPEYQGEFLNYLLADSIRNDLTLIWHPNQQPLSGS